jgi:hypothetical protein
MRAPRQFGLAALGLAAVALLLSWSGSVFAGPITTFFGIDPGAGPGDPRPNSDAAAALFDAAAGTSPATAITFENYPLGAFTTLNVTPGVTVTSSPANNARINNDVSNRIAGFNTTAGGSHWLRVGVSSPARSVTFTFANPVNAFGGYFTGVGDVGPGGIDISFNDGRPEDLFVPGDRTGGVLFFGFVDPGASISSVTVTPHGDDVIGVDDVRFASLPTAVPEPSPLALLTLGGGALAGWRRWRKRAPA